MRHAGAAAGSEGREEHQVLERGGAGGPTAPPGATDEEVLQRCIHLVSTSRGASRKFYQLANLQVKDAVRLMLAVLNSV